MTTVRATNIYGLPRAFHTIHTSHYFLTTEGAEYFAERAEDSIRSITRYIYSSKWVVPDGWLRSAESDRFRWPCTKAT